jgi:hypothetical protein
MVAKLVLGVKLALIQRPVVFRETNEPKSLVTCWEAWQEERFFVAGLLGQK